MAIKKTVGGDRLGTGGVLTTSLRAWERSTFDVGKTVKTTQGPGTLVPIYVEIVEKADIWDIELTMHTLTQPTVGPIFGMYKQQVDVFTSDFRLYNKQLHNNPQGVGLDMENIMLPQLRLKGKNPDATKEEQLNSQQISQDSLLAYTGIRGLGTLSNPNGTGTVEILRQAVPILTYYDIYKEYYANKQEQIGYVISPEAGLRNIEVSNAYIANPSGNAVVYLVNPDFLENSTVTGIAEGNGLIVRGVGVTKENIWTRNINQNRFLVKDWGEWTSIEETQGMVWFKGLKTGATFNRGDNSLGRPWIWAEGQVTTEVGEGIRIREFNLTNIDDMREIIFSHPKTSPLVIGHEGEELREYPYRAVTGQVETEGDGINMASWYTMAGLALKTHQADRFNAWLETTWVQRINTMTSINVVNGTFSVDALNIAKKMYKLNNSIVVSGNSYQDWLEAVYGEKTYGAPEMPVYRGGASQEISFEEVISSSETSSQPLGTLGGRGVTMGERTGGKIQFKAEEHGMIMIIASITPRIGYSQGNKWWTKLKSIDDIHKPELDQIGFQNLLTDEMAAWDTKVEANGTETFFSAGYQPAWTQYTTNQDEHYGGFAKENSEMFMVLDRRYEPDKNARIEDLTTYVDPVKYLYPFAYGGLDAQPFWCQYGIKATVRKKMAASQMPRP